MKMEIRQHRFRGVSLGVLLFAIACAIYSFSLPMGSLGNPGAGVWPAGLSIGLAISSLMLLVTERSGDDYEPLTKRTVVVVGGFALMAVFTLIFSATGLGLATLVLSLIWLRWLAGESWKTTVILSISFSVAFVVIFDLLLKLPMPRDLIIAWLIEGIR